LSSKDKDRETAKPKTTMMALEKRLLLDASTLVTTVNAIPSPVLNLDAQDIDGDGDFTDQPADGTDIQTWHDSFGGTVNDFDQDTASERPTYNANAFGTGIGGLDFDANDGLESTNNSTINTSGAFPEKSFAVVFRTGADVSGFQIVYEQGGAVRGFQVAIDDGLIYASGYNNTGTEWGADRYKIMNLGAVAGNTTYRVMMVFDSTAGSGFIKSNVNGGDFVQLDEVGAQQNHADPSGVGVENNDSFRPSTVTLGTGFNAHFLGSVGQIMSWNHALDDVQVRAVDAYLVHRWTNNPAIQFTTPSANILEGGSDNIDASELYTVDRNTTPANLDYQVTSLLNGIVRNNGVDVNVGGTFTQADIDSGLITFVHDGSDTISASFDYRVTDGSAQDTGTFVYNVTLVDDVGTDPPVINNNNTLSVVDGGSVNITSAALQILDTDTPDSALVFTVSATNNGSVFNNNTASTVVSFTQQDIDDGFIRFDHDGTNSGFAGFDFSVTDGTTPVTGTFNIGVTFSNTGVNDPPVIVVNTGDTLNVGGSSNILNTNLRTADPDEYTITGVTNGTVFRSGAALAVNDTFTQEDLNFGIVSFTHDGSATTNATIGFSVSDGNTTVTGATYVFGVEFNNPPTFGPAPGPFNLAENSPDLTLITTASAFDIDGDNLTYTIESGNALGVFQINPINGQLRIADNTNLDFENVTSFNLVIRTTDDGVGNPFDQYTIVVNVTNVDDAPVLDTNNTLSVNEGATQTIGVGVLSSSDQDNTAAQITYTVTAAPANGFVALSSAPTVAITSFTQAQIAASQVIYVHDGTNTTADSFTFIVSDGNTALGAQTFDITVNPANDAPAGADATFTIDEDVAYTFSAASFGFSDVNDSPANSLDSVIITTLPASGTLALSGTAVTLGQVVSAAQFGNLTFTPAANEFGTGYASFTFQVRDDGGTSNGGVDTDQSANTITFNVTEVNDAPDGADVTISIGEDASHTFTPANFGFSDVSDTPADTFVSVMITTLPTAGTLTLGGTAVTLGQNITVAQIPNLVFTPVANANGAGYATMTFQVRDNGTTANGGVDTDPVANTITFDVTSINDAPDGADNTVTTNEDVPFTFSEANFGLTDVNDSPANTLQSVIIDTLPAAGTLALSGTAVGLGQEITAAQIPNLVFTPVTGANGSNYASFTFSVRDNGGTSDGGVNLDTVANVMTIDVTALNDAPAGADITLSTNEDVAYTFSDTDFGFSDTLDSPANNFLSVVITTLPADGLLQLGATAVTLGQEIVVAQISNLTFTPAANQSGAGYTSFTFQVRDDGTTANGGVDLDASANMITFDVVAVNDAPDGTDGTVATDENVNYTFSIADFGLTDVNDTPANTFSSVIITTLPALGELQLSGATFVAGTEIAAGDIGNLVYVPPANQNGLAYTNFTFQVRDDGLTTNGGVDLDPVANTLSIDVRSVNDAPTGTDVTLSTDEDVAYTFSDSDFGFGDALDSPADDFLSVIITSLPTAGTLTLGGAVVNAMDEIAVAQIPTLVFTPAANANGAGYATMTFQVRDDGDTIFGGQDIDQSANTITFDVVSVNDAPDGTDVTLVTDEDVAYTFSDSDFGLTDVNDSPANALLSVIITSLPTAGTLTLGGAAVSANDEIDVGDIGTLVFTPAANANGAGYATMTFQVRDDGTTANSGIDLDPVANTITFDVTPVDDIPVIAQNNGLTLAEGATGTIATTLLSYTDIDTADGDIVYTVTTTPVNGQLERVGATGVAITSFTQDDLANNQIVYVHDSSETLSDSFIFEVNDATTTLTPAVTFNITVTPVNDAPIGADNTVTVLEDGVHTFIDTEFGFTDPNDTPADDLQAVVITTLPTNGVLALLGTPVTLNQVIVASALTDLTFTPAANANGAAYASFGFRVQDDGGTADGGVDLDQTERFMTIDVTSVDDAPEGADITLTTLEDTPYNFTPADLGFTDVSDSPANTFISVLITTLPASGTLTLSGAAVSANDEILFGDITNLAFVPDANDNGAGYTSFTFQVRDNGTTVNGGANLDATPNIVTFDVTSVNDAPAGGDNTVTTNEDINFTFSEADFGFTDVDDTPANNLQAVIISSVPVNGTLELSGATVIAGQSIAVLDIPNLVFVPALNANGAAADSFTFAVVDDDGTANSGQDTDQSPNVMTIDITSVNDAPDGTDNTITMLESTVFTFTEAVFGFTDAADTPANNFDRVIITAIPTNGTLALSTVPVINGQSIAVTDIPNLTFTPVTNLNGVGYDSFTFQVADDGTTANSGVDVDPVANTITFDVTPLNSAPDGADITINTDEDTAYTFTDADFGFSDVNDTPPNALASVLITTVPSDGVLALSGVAITAGDEITLAQIPNITFTPTLNENGAAYASFTFQVRDGGGTNDGGIDLDPVANTVTINVDAVNDAPDGADMTITTLEDTPYTFSDADFGFSDVNDSPADALFSVIITSLPTNGTLTLGGMAVSANDEIAATDIPTLVFTPDTNANGAGYATMTFQVRDDGLTTNGGEDTDQSANIITFDVTSVNDAPDGTDNIVTTLEDNAYTFQEADFGFTDVNDTPSNAFLSVIITSIPATGSLTFSGAPVTALDEIAVGDIGNLVFTPVANENGAAYASFTFQVRDDGGIANSGINLDAAANIMTIDVTSVNDAPDGADITLTTLEDTAYTFSDADFGFSDVSDTPANILDSVVITTLPASGILELGGTAVTLGQEIAVGDIGNLTFTPALNENGAGYTNFTFQVRDNGGTSDTGVDLDPVANIITFDVTSVDDAPEGTDNTVTTLEDAPYTFTIADFGYGDPSDTPAQIFTSVVITTIPATGTLTLSGNPVTAGDEIVVGDIGNLVFTPVANENGAGYTSFTFQVRDNGVTLNSGENLDQSANIMTIDVTSVNDAPDGADITLTTLEDTPLTFAATDFGLTDALDSPANALASVIITTIPLNGTLALSGAAVSAMDEIAVLDIPNLVFTPDLNDNGAAYASFTFQVRDDGGTANAGVDLDAGANTVTIDVTSVNDAPDGADITLTTLEDTPYTFSDTDFGFSDTADAPANILDSVVITTLPASGILELGGTPVTLGQEIAVGDIGTLVFTPDLNDNGAAYTSFTFQVRDNGGIADTGVDLDPIANTVTFDVTSVNDAPDGTDNTLSTLENIDLTFAAADFGFTDAADSPANAFNSVIITTLPASGTLELLGAAVTAGDEIAVADIPDLVFIPVPDENGPAYATFTFEVRDDGLTANSGVDLDVAPNIMTIDVISVNDAPDGADVTLTAIEDIAYTFSDADFGYSDGADTPPNNFLSVIITTLPANGTLSLSGTPVTTGQEIAVGDIPNLTFLADLNDNGPAYTSFTFQVRDDGGTNFAGIDIDQTPNIITFDVTSVNDEPDGTDNRVLGFEDTDYVFTVAEFGLTDPADNPDNALASVIITTLPARGALLLSGVAISAGDEIAVTDLPNFVFRPVPNENDAAYATFTFQIRDDGGTTNSGVDLDSTPNTMIVDISTVGDAPLGADNTVTTIEDTAYTFAVADFGFDDSADNPSNNFVSVLITTVPVTGTLELAGATVNAGDEILVASIPSLVFTPAANENGAGYADFTFQLRDDGALFSGGQNLDPNPKTMTIDVTSVNDAPDSADVTLNTAEDTPYTFSAADFALTDVIDTPANVIESVVITTLPAGTLEFMGAAVTAGQEIAIGDITNLVFTPAANVNGAAADSFTFQVRDDGGITNSGVDLDPTPNVVTFDISAVNDAPDGTDATLSVVESGVLNFTDADFGFTDVADTPANDLLSVVITSVPTVGVLALGGVPVTAGDELLLTDIPNLTFTPVANQNGTSYDSFTFQVRDDGTTANGGVDLDPVANVITIDVTPLNSEPLGADITLTTLEDTAYVFDAANFGFSDINDTPANDLLSVIITTLPADGLLELSGAAVMAGDEITLADIPNLTFTPALNENGASYTDFTFQVRDDGDTLNGGVDIDQSPNTITFDVTSVNDEPIGADNTITILEDAPYAFTDGDFGFTDTSDTPADDFLNVIIETLPTNGTLALSGAPVSALDVIAVTDIPNLVFTPLANQNGTDVDGFTFRVQDDGGTLNSGVDIDQSPNAIRFDITSVNDAPTGTNDTVTTLEDTDYTFTQADFGFTDTADSPANALLSLEIVNLPANGTLSLGAGATVPGAVVAGQIITAADLDHLIFTPVANENGGGYANFDFIVRDDGDTLNGGVDTDIAANTITIDVTSVNDEPAGADNTITILEDAPYTLTDADFGFSDVNDTPANAFLNVIIETLPANGILELNGTAVSALDVIAVTDFPNLVFTPALNQNGTAADSFTFRVQDDGTTSNSGVDTDQTPNTITFDITSVNDAPIGTDNTITAIEDTPFVFGAADFGFTDISDTPANALLSVVITTLPANGVLALSGAPITALDEIAVTDIPNLTFTPALNDNGAAYTSFTFQVRDDGTTANGGIDLDLVANTLTIDVTAVDDPPVLDENNTLNTFEGFTAPITTALLSSSDVDTLAGDIVYTITAPPSNGQIELTSDAGVAITSFTQADLDNGLVVYVHDSSETIADSFDFEVSDAVNMLPVETFDIVITPVNDEPAGADNTITILEDAPYTFTDADFGFSDVNDTPSNALLNVIIDTLPTNGTLALLGVPVTAGQVIAAGDLTDLVFTPLLNQNGAGADSFTFSVQDNGGTANTGVDTDQTPNVITFDITSVNDAPDGTNGTLSVNEDSVLTFEEANFGFSDAADSPANNFQSVIITALPVNGLLELSGAVVNLNDEIAVGDIQNLTFTPPANANGAAYASVSFQVRDDGGVSDSGVDLDPVDNVLTIDVVSVNDAPLGADNTVTALEDVDFLFSAADFGFTDPSDTPADDLLNVIIDTLPANGTLSLGAGATAPGPVSVGQVIAAADLDDLIFRSALNDNGAGADSFTFRVQDDGGTTNSGVDTDVVARIMTIDVTSVNDEPAGADNTITILEDAPYTFTDADFGFSDTSDTPADDFLNVIIETLPANGILELNGTAVSALDVIAVTDISNLVFTPLANQNGTDVDGFTFRVQDDGGTLNSGVDIDQTPNAIRFDITSVNDAPTGTDGTVTTLEDTDYTFTQADFGFTDTADSPANALLSLEIVNLPANGTLSLGAGATVPGAVVAGQIITAADLDHLVFTPVANENGAGYANFDFIVRDDGDTLNGGVDTDIAANTITIDVTSVNDEPAGADNTITILEDAPYTFTDGDFGFSDVNDTPANAFLNVIIETLPANGTLELGGTAVSALDVIAVTDIPNLVFTPALNQNGTDVDGFTFRVQDDGDTLNSGVDIDQTPNAIRFDITSVNDAPTGTDGTVTTLEDTDYTFTQADFGFTDTADSPANALLSLEIVNLPTDGTLILGAGATVPGAVVAGQVIAATDLDHLLFTPVANENGAGYANFDFIVRDDGDTLNGGVDTDIAANTITIDVTSVNDEPAGADNTITILEDAPYTFTDGDFGFSDTSDTPADDFLNVIIETLPTNGILELNGTAVSALDVIAVTDIPNLVFTPALNQNGAAADSFTFRVQDDDGTSNGGVDTDQSPNTITFDITSVNDAPIGTDNTITVLEDTSYTFADSDFGFTDAADTPANNFVNVIVDALPTNGTLELASVPVNVGDVIAFGDITNLVFTPAPNVTAASDFVFRVQDNGGTANGGVDIDTTARAITLDIISVNDAPVGTDNTVIASEDIDFVFSAADFGLTDPLDNPANGLLNVIIDTIPTTGTLSLNAGASAPGPVTAGQVIALADIDNLIFRSELNESGPNYEQFTFRVQDDGGTANGGLDTDLTPRTMTIDVLPLNDAPVINGTAQSFVTLEDTPLPAGFVDLSLGFADPNDSPFTGANAFQGVRIVSAPAGGVLELMAGAGAPGIVSSGQFITAADLAFMRYVPDLNGNGIGYGSFTFQAQDDGGTPNGGNDLSVVYTVNIDVTPVNDAPEGIVLSRESFFEGLPGGTAIAQISSIDVDSTVFTYSFVGDPSIFSLSGNNLVIDSTQIFGRDPSSFNITLRTSDGFLTFDQAFTINLIEVPAPIAPPQGVAGGDDVDNDDLFNLNPDRRADGSVQFFVTNIPYSLMFQSDQRYGNEGLLDSALSTSDRTMMNTFYGLDGLQDLLKTNAIERIRDLLIDIRERTGSDLDPRLVRDLIDLALQEKSLIREGEMSVPDQPSTLERLEIYENNRIYQALVNMGSGEEGDESEAFNIIGAAEEEGAQYLHRQLDEAALYYRSKNDKLIDALTSSE